MGLRQSGHGGNDGLSADAGPGRHVDLYFDARLENPSSARSDRLLA